MVRIVYLLTHSDGRCHVVLPAMVIHFYFDPVVLAAAKIRNYVGHQVPSSPSLAIVFFLSDESCDAVR